MRTRADGGEPPGSVPRPPHDGVTGMRARGGELINKDTLRLDAMRVGCTFLGLLHGGSVRLNLPKCKPPEEFTFANPSEWQRGKGRVEHFRINASLKLTDERKNNYNDVLKAFENHFAVRKNIVYDTFLRREQREEAGVEEFVAQLHQLAKLCSYEELHDEMTRDSVVVCIRDRKLSERKQLDAEDRTRSYYAARKQRKEGEYSRPGS
ncbi:hypothetical protein HPB50_029584 [Hyalomma asiaticum]|nr:hypothetical protein HPB50_029584 [Hyalomma asiaticum]